MTLIFLIVTLLIISKEITLLLFFFISLAYFFIALIQNKTVKREGKNLTLAKQQQTEIIQETLGSKKDIVLKVILDLVNESECDEDKKVVLRELIEEGTLETTIEFVVDASKGKLELNKKTKKKLLGCLGQCLVTLSKK